MIPKLLEQQFFLQWLLEVRAFNIVLLKGKALWTCDESYCTTATVNLKWNNSLSVLPNVSIYFTKNSLRLHTSKWAGHHMVCTTEKSASTTTRHKLLVETVRRAKLWRINFHLKFQFPLLYGTLILVAFYRAATNQRVSKIVWTIFIKNSVFHISCWVPPRTNKNISSAPDRAEIALWFRFSAENN